MKTKRMLGAVLGAAFLLGGVLQAGAELFSVNLWSPGRNWAEEWQQESWRDTVRMAGKTGGVWETDDWTDIDVSTIAAGNSTTFTGSEGTTATFTIDAERNQSPYNWTTLRDGTTDPTENEAYMADGNATLLDAKLVGTERDNLVGGITVSGLTMDTYDVIIYLSMNSAQFGGGGNAGRGFISFNGGDTTEWFIPSGQPPTTFTEIVNSGDTGNYIMYKGVTGSSFSAEFYGHDFNHGGIAGFQIIPEPGTVTVLGIGLGALLLRRRLRKR